MERLSPERLKQEQQKTLETPRMRYGVLARLLFGTMDLLYGRKKTLSKFKVLEVIARVPYQAWENVAYIAITHTHPDPGFARRIFDRVRESRLQQDNEQWHLLILGELTGKRRIDENLLLHGFIPQVIAFFYYHISWILYVIRPKWSYMLNANFEDHAEHEYMEYVAENAQLEAEPFDSMFAEDYGKFPSLADMFRQIGYDERVHKAESLARLDAARFQ
jgi:ubiquinol oxidase